MRAVRTDARLGDDSAAAPSRLRPAALLSKVGRSTFPLAAPTWPGSVTRPAPDPELGVHYDTSWSRRYPVRLARAVVLDNITRPLTHALASPNLLGEEGLVGLEAPVIFAANHTSHIDTPLLLACLPLRSIASNVQRHAGCGGKQTDCLVASKPLRVNGAN